MSVVHENELHLTHGVLRVGCHRLSCVGCHRLSFAEYRLFHRPLLQKRPIILSILLTKASFTWCITWEWITSYSWDSIMGWLRLVGSLKLYVSFAKEPYKRDDILQNRTQESLVHPTHGKLDNLEIQTFEVWSPPWVVKWEWVTSYMWECITSYSWECITSYIWKPLQTLWVSTLCITCRCVMSHMRMRHVSRKDELWGWVMSHLRMSHASHENEIHHTRDWVTPHMRVYYIIHMETLTDSVSLDVWGGYGQ